VIQQDFLQLSSASFSRHIEESFAWKLLKDSGLHLSSLFFFFFPITPVSLHPGREQKRETRQ